MNYSDSISYRGIAKRICVLSAVCGLTAGGVGFSAGYAARANRPIMIYGLPDGIICRTDDKHKWERDDDFVYLADVPLSEETQRFIYRLSEAYDIDYPLVLAIIDYESGFETNAVSATNDYGLMQVNRVNHAKLNNELGVSDFLDPYQNIKAGMFILRKLFDKYESTDTALMAYHMGESGAAKLWDKGIYTSKYSQAICAKADEYRLKLTTGGIG